MRASVRRLLIVLALFGGGAIAYLIAAQALAPPAAARSAHRVTHHRPTVHGSVHRRHNAADPWPHIWSVDARLGVREFLGGDRTRVGWSKALAEWGGTVGPHW